MNNGILAGLQNMSPADQTVYDNYANLSVSNAAQNIMKGVYPPDPTYKYFPMFHVRKIRNGYILAHSRRQGAIAEEDFCADYNEVGQRVTALLVQFNLTEP